ncbi:MAG: prepilin peptidase [Deltaproteobacteria bacterium]|nr:prepilin peptidase [Deltaproteobacteria bacterium]
MIVAELPSWFVLVFSWIFGGLWGSFANVVVYRWPREMSVASPPSHCPHCGVGVKPYDNVPVFAWLWLRGKCRACREPISWRYPAVELVFSLLSVAIAWRLFRGESALALSFGAALGHYLSRFAVAFALGVTALIDLDEMLVPHFTRYFALAPLAAAALLPRVSPSVDLLTAIAGAGLGYFGLRALFIDGFALLTGRPGMGLGDAEVLIVVGAALGPAGVLFALGAGALQGVIATVVATVMGVRVGPAHAADVEDVEDFADEQPPIDQVPSDPAEESLGESTGSASTPPEKMAKIPFVPFLALGALEYLLGADVWVARWLSGQ